MLNVFLKDEQLKSHEAKVKQISTELAEHRSYPPDKKLKGKEVDDYKLKDHYLEFEVYMEALFYFLGWLYIWGTDLYLYFSLYFPRKCVLARQKCHSNCRCWDVALLLFFLMRTSLPVNLDPSL